MGEQRFPGRSWLKLFSPHPIPLLAGANLESQLVFIRIIFKVFSSLNSGTAQKADGSKTMPVISKSVDDFVKQSITVAFPQPSAFLMCWRLTGNIYMEMVGVDVQHNLTGFHGRAGFKQQINLKCN